MRLTAIHATISNHLGDWRIYRWRQCKIKEPPWGAFSTVFWYLMLWNFFIQQLETFLIIIRTTNIFDLQKFSKAIIKLTSRKDWITKLMGIEKITNCKNFDTASEWLDEVSFPWIRCLYSQSWTWINFHNHTLHHR